MKLFNRNASEPFQEAELEVLALTYHGWYITLSENRSAFTFQCYPPELQDFIDSGEEFADQETALQEARTFVDREIAIQAILDVINEWFWSGLISEEEYWNLTNFS